MAGRVTVRLASSADRAAWDAFVAGNTAGDLLQSWAWGTANARAGDEPLRLVAERRGSLCGVAQLLPRRIGFGKATLYVPHGPLWARDRKNQGEILEALIPALRAQAQEAHAILVQVDPRTPMPPGGDVGGLLGALDLAPSPDTLQARTTRILALHPDPERLAAGWTRRGRNLVRRSRREGVEVRIERTADPGAVTVLARLLQPLAVQRGFCARSQQFLLALAEELSVSGSWYLGIASRDGVPLATMAAPRFGPLAYYLYGAANRDERHRHAFAAYGLMGAMLEALGRDGVAWFDMWGVAERDDPRADPAWRGFSDFKARFGGTPLAHPGTFELPVSRSWCALRSARRWVREQRDVALGHSSSSAH